MKRYLNTNTISGTLLILFASWMIVSQGHNLIAKICVWLGLLSLLSVKGNSPKVNRILLYIRIGLTINILAFLAMFLFSSQIVGGNRFDERQFLELWSLLQWIALPVVTLVNNLVGEQNWALLIFPEYGTLYDVATWYTNVFFHMGLTVTLLLGGETLWLQKIKKGRADGQNVPGDIL